MTLSKWRRGFFLSLAIFSGAVARADETVWLDSLDLATMHQGWGSPQPNHSVTGQPISIRGVRFERGVGTHANSVYVLDLRGGSSRFSAVVGLDDDTQGRGSVIFQILADGRKVYDSGTLTASSPPRNVDLKLRGVKRLVLKVNNGEEGIGFDHADWANARFKITGAAPRPFVPPPEKKYYLTPKPGPAPRINGPKIYGARPGHPFLYRIPAQGERPMKFSADNLPDGLRLDESSGIISGTTPRRGEYGILFHAENGRGSDQRAFKLVSGDTLALTPPMGWNDWYAYYSHVTDAKVRRAADAMIDSGMADAGYQYVDIDDCWANTQKSGDADQIGPFRDSAGIILPNKHFPDMRGLTDYIHAKGLKAGIYTSPGPTTCAGFAGTYQHEAQDARQFADWGFDFLKYDWCSYGGVCPDPGTLKGMKAPYALMGGILEKLPRDFVFNLCQYGMGEVWKWGADVGGNSWRTAGDLGMELQRFMDVALENSKHREWQKPGAWNDPDYVQIGFIGGGGGLVASPLSPTEQYAFMSLWCLMASPIFYSGDMEHLDNFTLNVLCNPEVIEIDQDPLGEGAKVIMLDDERFLMVKKMGDGSVALGLGNRGETDAQVRAVWKDLGLAKRERVRDVWREKDLGIVKTKFKTTVRRHGVVLLRLQPVQ